MCKQTKVGIILIKTGKILTKSLLVGVVESWAILRPIAVSGYQANSNRLITPRSSHHLLVNSSTLQETIWEKTEEGVLVSITGFN